MNWMLDYQWEIFIVLEILSVLSLTAFGILRYWFMKPRVSVLLIVLFLLLLILEAALGLLIFRETGKISTFQIVITVFVLYAVTFGIFDFLKLDRWMRRKIGGMRGVDLLSDKDRAVIEKNKDPKYIAGKYRMTSIIHTIVFLTGQGILWSMGTDSFSEAGKYLTDFSWIEAGDAEYSPYSSDVTFSIGMLWALVFAVDFIYSWSYTVFPSKKK